MLNKTRAMRRAIETGALTDIDRLSRHYGGEAYRNRDRGRVSAWIAVGYATRPAPRPNGKSSRSSCSASAASSRRGPAHAGTLMHRLANRYARRLRRRATHTAISPLAINR